MTIGGIKDTAALLPASLLPPCDSPASLTQSYRTRNMLPRTHSPATYTFHTQALEILSQVFRRRGTDFIGTECGIPEREAGKVRHPEYPAPAHLQRRGKILIEIFSVDKFTAYFVYRKSRHQVR